MGSNLPNFFVARVADVCGPFCENYTREAERVELV